MAKVTAPLLSIGASGTIGDTITFARWKGVAYGRQRVVPANPKTAAQTSTRNTFRTGTEAWRDMPGGITEVWNAFAEGRALAGRNAFIGFFTRLLRGEITLADMVASPSARSGQTVTSIGASTGAASGEIDITYELPPTPDGWTMDSVRLFAAREQDPTDPWTNDTHLADDEIMSGSDTLTGLTPTENYRVFAFIVWTRPDGRKAYGASRSAEATAGA